MQWHGTVETSAAAAVGRAMHGQAARAWLLAFHRWSTQILGVWARTHTASPPSTSNRNVSIVSLRLLICHGTHAALICDWLALHARPRSSPDSHKRLLAARVSSENTNAVLTQRRHKQFATSWNHKSCVSTTHGRCWTLQAILIRAIDMTHASHNQ